MRQARSLVAVGALFLAVCAPAPVGAPLDSPAGGPPPEPAKETPQRGGALLVPGTQAPENLHPYTQASSAFVSRAVGPVYETLVSFEYERKPADRWDIDFKVVPWLAESWQQPSETTYLFQLRQGVTWHDGTEFTADDLVFSFDQLRDPKNAFTFRGNLADVAAVEKAGPYSVRLTTKAPTPAFLSLIARGAEVNIIPTHAVERGDDLHKVAIGTGPFRLKEFDRTKASVFTRYDGYWQKGRPYMEQVQVVHGLDDAARLAGFIAGKFDVLSLPDKLQLGALLAQKRDAQYGSVINAMGFNILLKQDAPPFSDLRVRQALHLALDRQDLNQVAALGEGTIIPPGVPAIKEGWAIPQGELLKLPGYRQPKDADLAEAKRLLAEAGYPGGLKSSLTFGTNSFPQRAIAEPLAAQYAKVGIDLAIKALPGPEHTRALRTGNYEMALNGTADMLVATRQWDHLHSTGGDNRMGVADPQLDRLLEAQRGSREIAEQKRAVRTMQELLLEKLYIIATIDIPVYQLWQPWVKNYNFNFAGSPLIHQINVGWMWLDVAKMPSDRR